MLKKVKNYGFTGYLLILILFIGCVPTSKQSVLSFFFDGVSNIETQHLNANQTKAQADSSIISKPNLAEILVYSHQPYKERACDLCHNSHNLGEFILPEPELCYQCHDDLHTSLQILHAPVEAGYCSQCHNPHSANDSSLLLFKGNDLCFYCHDSELLDKNPLHKGITESCLNCHSAHGGTNNIALQANSCNKCHQSIKDQFAVVHGPVDADLCQECHSSHTSTSDNKLLSSGQNLCLKCHPMQMVMKNEMHLDIQDGACTNCHNPHGGADRFMLY